MGFLLVAVENQEEVVAGWDLQADYRIPFLPMWNSLVEG